MKTGNSILWGIRLALVFGLLGWAQALRATAVAGQEEDDLYAVPKVSDPLESMNRAVFKFNDGFYAHILRPFARGYERTMPLPARRGIANFFDNLRFPIRFVSDVLQAKPGRATKETGKFLINSTVGLAGFVRVSDSVPSLAAVPPEDIGQSFGVWGVAPGPYLVLPLLGPCSLRDMVGLAGNIMLNPVNWTATEDAVKGFDFTWRIGVQSIDFMNSSPEQIRVYDDFKQSAVDPYIAVRTGYQQYRAACVEK